MILAPQLPWGVRKVRHGRTRTILIGPPFVLGATVLRSLLVGVASEQSQLDVPDLAAEML